MITSKETRESRAEESEDIPGNDDDRNAILLTPEVKVLESRIKTNV
jgi:hypothetical protein